VRGPRGAPLGRSTHEHTQSPRRGHRRRPCRRRPGLHRSHRIGGLPASRASHGGDLDVEGAQARRRRPVRDRGVQGLPRSQRRTRRAEAGRRRAQRPLEPDLPALPHPGAVPRPLRRPVVLGPGGLVLPEVAGPRGDQRRDAPPLPRRARQRGGDPDGAGHDARPLPPRWPHGSGQQRRGVAARLRRLPGAHRHRLGHHPAPDRPPDEETGALPGRLPQCAALLDQLRAGPGHHAGRRDHAAAEVRRQDAALRGLRLHRTTVPRGLRGRQQPHRGQGHDRRDHRRLCVADDRLGRADVCDPETGPTPPGS